MKSEILRMSPFERRQFMDKAKEHLPPQSEIAIKAGVSPSLVSYTLGGFGKNEAVVETIIELLPASFWRLNKKEVQGDCR